MNGWSKRAAWAGVILPILFVVAGVWWYLRDDQVLNQQWFREDQEWNAEIIQRLDTIETRLGQMERDFVVALDRHEEFASAEQQRQTVAIAEGFGEIALALADMAYALGQHQGAHE